MKILEIIPSFRSAGAEKFVVELSNQFNSLPDVEVIILQLYPFCDEDLLLPLVDKRIRLETLNKPMGFSLKAMIDMFRFIRKGNYDYIHAHTTGIQYLLLPCLLLRRPFYCATIHSEAKRESGNAFTAFVRKIIFKCQLCQPVTISEESHKSFKEYYNINAPIIYNGIHSYRNDNASCIFEGHKQDDIIFVHIARTHKVKNQLMLYKSIRRLRDEGAPVYLYHYGRFDDPLISKELQENAGDGIRIMGETPDPQSVLKFADAMCMTSLMEGMPMTIIEAFSVGCPVICTPVGGCKNMVVDSVNGFLSDTIEEDSYTETLRRFINQSKVKKIAMRENALRSFREYSIENTSKKYLELYRNR